jgi:hypothetical protein
MTEQNLPRLRWGRPLVAALLVEVGLVIPTMALFATMEDPTQALNFLIPPLALILFIPAGYWCGKGTSAPVLNGFIAGLWGIGLYVALTLYMQGAVADFDFESSVRPAYLLAHGLKVVGGIIGGMLVARKQAA